MFIAASAAVTQRYRLAGERSAALRRVAGDGSPLSVV